MKNVCFDLSAAIQESAGISQYETQLASSLIKLDGPEHYSFFGVSPNSADATSMLNSDLAALPNRIIRTSNKVWRLKSLFWHLLQIQRDQQVFPKTMSPNPPIFHGMNYTAPPLKAASVISVHDLSFLLYPQLHSLLNRLYLNLALPMCIAKANRILVISENTGNDLVNRFGSKIREKLRVTPLGVSDESYFQDLSTAEIQAELSKFNLDYRSFILSVGTIEPRKNQTQLVKAYAELLKNWNRADSEKPTLVLVGKCGWNKEYERLKAEATELGLTLRENSPKTGAGQVLLLTQINNTTLKILYQGAAVTCYISLYEGFGLPALEALAAGSPLITSNNSSLPEVTGTEIQTALLIDPMDTAQLVRNLQKLFEDRDLVEKLRLAGRERAKLFTWKRTAYLTRKVYEEIGTKE